MRLLTGLLGALLGSFVLSDLHAATNLAPDNGGGVDLRLFRSAVDSKGFFTVDGAEVIGRGDVAFGLVLDGGRFKNHVIDTQLHGVLLGSYSPLRNLTVGMGVPTDLVSGDPLASPPAGILPGQKTDVNAFFTGAWLAYAKYRFFDNLAVVVRTETALSDDARRGYAASPGTTLTPTLVLEGRLRRLRVGANLGASALFGDGSRIGDIKHGHLARAGVALSYRLTDDLDLVAESYGSKLISAGAASAEAVGGVKVFVEKNSYLMLGGGVGYTDGYQAAAQRAFLGFVFEPSIGDRDGDGVRDDVDQCPDTPEDRDGFHDEDGCPDPDNDQDNILDKDDQCPNEAETWNGYIDDDGCPDKLPGDHESLLDVEEKPVLVFEHGIGTMLEPIQFEYDSVKIAKESWKTVDEVAKILKGHDDYTLIEIGGHADERGNDKYNLELTQKRVESVRKALIDRGINPSRLRARGYGEYCPLEDGHTEEAWKKNRRVEFRVVETKSGPSGVLLGCPNALAHGVKP